MLLAVLICAVKTVGAFLVLMLITTNLTGMIVRPFFDVPLETPPDTHAIIANEYVKARRSRRVVDVVFWLVTALFFWLLWSYAGPRVFAAALMLAVSRAVDLVVELRSGKTNTGFGAAGVVSWLLTWGPLPVLWFNFWPS